MKRYWTPKEERQLELNYGNAPTWAIAEKMGRSEMSVSRKASRMGLHAPVGGPRPHSGDNQFGCDHRHAKRGRCWSGNHVVMLELWYGNKPVEEIARYLGRSEQAVMDKANQLGLLSKLNRAYHALIDGRTTETGEAA